MTPITNKRKKPPKLNIVTPELGKPFIHRVNSTLNPLAATFKLVATPAPVDCAQPTATPAPDDCTTGTPAPAGHRLVTALAAPSPPPAPVGRPSTPPAPVGLAPPPKGYTYPADRPPDELDRLIRSTTNSFIQAADWETFFLNQRDPRGDWNDMTELNHPAAHLLRHYQHSGVPVKFQTKRWTKGQKNAALNRGPHKSAKEHIDFLREEFASMIKKGHWVLLPARLLRDHPDARFSPLGVVPQHDRRPRTISDYSYFDINKETLQLAPPEAMQFGRALQRLLGYIHRANPRYGPVYMSKIDIADGFYRLGLRPTDAPKLAVLFPTRPGEEQLVGIPLTLPMGWLESPPAFCTMTETTTDLANAVLNGRMDTVVSLPHRLDAVSETPEPTTTKPPDPTTNSKVPSIQAISIPTCPSDSIKYQKPVRYWDVYVDDFLGLAQGGKQARLKIKRALLHSLDRIMRPLSKGDNPNRQEPASIKKLLKGDGTWCTRKVMLGWIVDTKQGTIELTPRRQARLHQLLEDIKPGQKLIATKTWHKVLGELRSMALALPGARGLFSLLQEAFRHEEHSRPRLRLTTAAHEFLDDFRWLAADLASRPTRISEIIATQPSIIGACDAAGTGMGGVFFVPSKSGQIQPYLWRQPFSKLIQDQLVSFNNPNGTITNSDLELCGNVAHHDVIAQLADIRERTIWTGSDNTANVYWQRKGSTTTTGPAAYLLRDQALHQRYHRYVPQHDYVPGTANTMADDCSRLWHLSDSHLLAHFNLTYPQTQSWRACHLSSDMSSKLISSLFKTTSSMASHKKLPNPRIPIGKSGILFAPKQGSTHSSENTTIPSPSSISLATSITRAYCPPAVNPSQLTQYRTCSARSVRSSCGWGPTIRGSPTTTAKLTTESPNNSGAGLDLNPRPRASVQYPSPSSPSSSTWLTHRCQPSVPRRNAPLRT